MKSLPVLLWLLAFGLLTLSVPAVESPAETYLRLPPMQSAPVIDGKSEADEWRMGSPSFGSYSRQTGMLSRRDVHHCIGYDDTCLFLSQRSELPPAPMSLSAGDRIVVSFGEDGLTPVVFQRDGSCDVAGVVSRATQHDGTLDFEAAIPWRAFGIPSLEEGREYRLQVARIFQNLSEEVTWSWGEAGRFVPQRGIPAVGFKTFGNRWKAAGYDIQWSAFNPGEGPAPVKLSALMVSIEPPSHLDTLLSPEPGQEVEGTLRAILTPLDRTIRSSITDARDGSLLYRRDFSWHAGTGVAYVDPDPPYVLDIGIYPTKRVAKARITCVNRDKLMALQDISFRIEGEDGTVYCRLPAENFQARWPLPELPLGTYDLVAELRNAQGKTTILKRDFTIREFPWQGTNIGLKPTVLPPYVPLTYSQETVTGLQTAYRLGAALWESIQVPGGELLARPVQLTFDGVPATPATPPALREAREDKITLESTLEAPRGVRARLLQEYDFDGFCKVTLTLEPTEGPVPLSSVRLDIPLKSEDVQYVCALGNGMRKNIHRPLDGKEGLLWESLEESEKQYRHHGFRPYIWLGETYRGMAFVCETPLHWQRAEKSSAQEILREGDTTILRLNLANTPFQLEAPKTIVFALQATPTRPQDPLWRKQYGTMYNGQNPRQALCLEYNIANVLRFMCARVDDGVAQVPNDDWSFVDYMAAATWETEGEVREFAQGYLRRNGLTEENFSAWEKGAPEKGNDLVTRMFQGCRFWKNTQINLAYMNPKASCPSWPEWGMYVDEWFMGAWRPAKSYRDQYSGLPGETYIDFLLWNSLRLIEKGWKGLYLDNLYDSLCEDPELSPYGTEGMPIWHFFKIRELVRRTAVTAYEHGLMLNGRPLLMIHLTDCNVVPWLSLASHGLDWEMNFGDKPYPQRFSDAYIQTDTLGTQTGVTPFVLVNAAGANGVAATKSALALTFAYGLLAQTDCGITRTPYFFQLRDAVWEFGYGEPTTEVFPCWRKDNPVKECTPGVRACFLRRADRQAMLLVGNLTDADTTAEFLLPQEYTVIDGETRQEHPLLEGRRLLLPVKAYSPAILYLKPTK